MSYLYGLHSVSALLETDPGQIESLWVLRSRKDSRLTRLVERARRGGVALREVDRRALDELAPGGRHQGVVAACRAAPVLGEPDLDALLDSLQAPPLLLILDGVQDPHNLGACLRTADATGVHAVVVPRDRAAGLTPVVRKVASGGAESVPLVQITNLARVLGVLQQRGIWLVGLAGEAEQPLYRADLKGPLALVLGGEEKGLRRLTREHCDLLARIPMLGAVESLNVSVAAGVCLYEALRQRNSAGGEWQRGNYES